MAVVINNNNYEFCHNVQKEPWWFYAFKSLWYFGDKTVLSKFLTYIWFSSSLYIGFTMLQNNLNIFTPLIKNIKFSPNKIARKITIEILKTYYLLYKS